MKKRNLKKYIVAFGFLGAFILWTVMLCCVDVQPIGPQGSSVGFAACNRLVHSLTGVNMLLYTVTDRLGLVPILFVLGFAALGLAQWIKRKSITRVDRSILVLGGFYAVVLAVYVLFEKVVINYRPVLIDGVLEASYPSSTTMLVMCVMPTAAMQLHNRIQRKPARWFVVAAITVFTVFMVVGRLISGVHWVSDIIGGALLSGFLVMLYCATSGSYFT